MKGLVRVIEHSTGDEAFRNQLLVRVEEAARLCDLSRSRMYELIQSGEVPSVGIGRSRRIPIDSLKEWIRNMVRQQGVA